MIDFELYNDVIVDFSKNETFTRTITTINNLGREVRTPQPSINFFCYIHPASDKDIKSVSREGYHPESMIKIFAKVDDDIKKDDIVSYSGDDYRVMKTNTKLVGDYKKLFAELLRD